MDYCKLFELKLLTDWNQHQRERRTISVLPWQLRTLFALRKRYAELRAGLICHDAWLASVGTVRRCKDVRKWGYKTPANLTGQGDKFRNIKLFLFALISVNDDAIAQNNAKPHGEGGSRFRSL